MTLIQGGQWPGRGGGREHLGQGEDVVAPHGLGDGAEDLVDENVSVPFDEEEQPHSLHPALHDEPCREAEHGDALVLANSVVQLQVNFIGEWPAAGNAPCVSARSVAKSFCKRMTPPQPDTFPDRVPFSSASKNRGLLAIPVVK